ncbi:peptidase S8/S53 domain-containing protein [Pelagophyceae sp. CCMP2097]|nr:peptidase S8/S53 domain-containing protein [Pelagophyceae sp. CCMP2097]
MRTTLLLAAGAAARVVEEPALVGGWGSLQNMIFQQHAEPGLTLRFQLHENMDKVREVAKRVSDPVGPDYGKYLSKPELDAITAPDASHSQIVGDWLAAWPGTAVEKLDDAFIVRCGAGAVEQALSTSVRLVKNIETSQTAFRASAYTLPEHVESLIKAVFGLHGLPLPPSTPLRSGLPADVTPSVIYDTYGVSGVSVQRKSKNRQAVAEFQGQTMNSTDLKTFFSELVPDYQPGDDTVAYFIGDAGDRLAEVEASLDIQYMMGVAPGVATSFYLYDPRDFCADLKNWTSAILGQDEPEWVHSVSYGWQGSLAQIGCAAAEQAAVDDDFVKLASRGVTIVFASGDSGSGYSGTTLYPSWPASSPWVTAVGGTRFVDQNVTAPEMATDQFGSGGGFSADYAQAPDANWQAHAAANYLAKADRGAPFPPNDSFDPSGRATPDVSALGEGYKVQIAGRYDSVGGTSASAPVFAGLVSLLNEARAQQGKARLGFLNPWLYSVSNAFTDVLVGTNAIGRGNGPIKYGYDCTPGWDPATGLGTPIFKKLLKQALLLP